jgi:hydrogenase expression/formation protein HypC
MCLAVIGRITKRKGQTATVNVLGVMREISVVLVPKARVGDYVMIHAGFAINTIDEQEARRTEAIIREAAGR